ncbi:MAG: MBL fold metallo-hydrolase [Gemmatimonadetes bacterium]|nr:MBL fold metallo-hydrolase [Gemmatimonadota bacterium]MYC69702.1 MBL fold metallo-hydrolase [Gemmatimonadota bacterium]
MRFLNVCPLIAALLAASPATAELSLHQLSDAVYVLQGGGGNVGVCVGDDGILLVDDKLASQADAVRAALARFDGQPEYIFNTHFHGDHIGGNRAFGQHATILAHVNVRKRLAMGGEFGKRHIEPEPVVALPEIAFEQSASVFFNGEEIRAVHFPRAHTDGDIAVFFVNAQIAHLGDLFFNGIFPFVDLEYGGDVETLTQHIAALIDQLPTDAKIIPGHGPVATLDDLKAYHRMLVETTDSVRTSRAAGMSLDQISAEGLDDQWASWAWSFVPARRWIETVYWSFEAGAGSD